MVTEWQEAEMATVFDKVANLREVLFGMEQDLGITGLNHNETEIVYAISRLANDHDGPIPSEDIRSHPLVGHMSQPTYNRALKSLIEKGYVGVAPNHKGRKYVPGEKMIAKD